MTPDLAAEIRDLAARRDITDAACRYMRGLDRLDAALQRTAFHDDAWIDCGLWTGGPDGFVAFAQDMLRGLTASQHLMGQVQLSISGETARGEIYFQAWHRTQEAGEPKDVFVSGRYIDEYACRAGDWRIVKRRLLVDWVRTDTASDDYFIQNPAAIRSGRGGADFSETRDWEAAQP